MAQSLTSWLCIRKLFELHKKRPEHAEPQHHLEEFLSYMVGYGDGMGWEGEEEREREGKNDAFHKFNLLFFF